MSEANQTRAYYDQAIDRLDELAVAEPSSEKRKQIYQQIARLRHEMIDAAFDAIVNRTPLLRQLMAELQQAIAIASNVPSVAGAVTKITSLIGQVKKAVDTVTGAAGALGGAVGGARGKRGPAGARVAGAAAVAGGAEEGGGGGRGLKVLCVHGVGDHHSSLTWQADWSRAILRGLSRWDPGLSVRFEFIPYDGLFAEADLDAGTVASAIWRLGSSGIIHGIGDLFRRRARGVRDIPQQLRWTAGMVAQWADDGQLRARTRRLVEQWVERFDPDVIAAHSLGSLITYDTFSRNPGAVEGRTYISFGSQIGNPFVRSTFAGRIGALRGAREWYHLFNEEDNAFAHDLRITAENFTQVATEFDDGLLDHDAVRYLSHPNTEDVVWRELATPDEAEAPRAKAMGRAQASFRVAARRPQKRALLIGINDYPNPEDRLEGCVNDVFRVSAALQESGFDPDDIRVVFDDRATSAGILDRLQWLLDGVCPGDTRFLYYSGHGAQIPTYGINNVVDHVNECLVPYDFDWSLERAITDRQFFELYSQLPYDCDFAAMFDCCHSGGLTRQGGHKVRGLNPPDDVRHRALRWDVETQMWADRDLKEVQKRLHGPLAAQEKDPAWTGRSGAEMRLGRANALRLKKDEQKKREGEYGHDGPFMPVLLQACRADQLAYEYRDGVTSFGAFTFALVTALRHNNLRGKAISWQQLVDRTTEVLEKLRYDQVPCLVGPKKVISRPVPFGGVKRKKSRK